MLICSCLDDSLFEHYKEQITDLTLISNEENSRMTSVEYTKDVYSIVLSYFKNLECLRIIPTAKENYPESIYKCPLVCLNGLAPTFFSSSNLTKLCVHVREFNDCFTLLDGRHKQLTVFIVEVIRIEESIMTNQTRVSLLNG